MVHILKVNVMGFSYLLIQVQYFIQCTLDRPCVMTIAGGWNDHDGFALHRAEILEEFPMSVGTQLRLRKVPFGVVFLDVRGCDTDALRDQNADTPLSSSRNVSSFTYFLQAISRTRTS
jgi:hypothetical protein